VPENHEQVSTVHFLDFNPIVTMNYFSGYPFLSDVYNLNRIYGFAFFDMPSFVATMD